VNKAYPRCPALSPRSKLVRKSIARVLTVMNQAKKNQLRLFYKVRACFTLEWQWQHAHRAPCGLLSHYRMFLQTATGQGPCPARPAREEDACHSQGFDEERGGHEDA
jgi:hypothetical protein